MKYDVLLAGVGGQGVLSVAAIIATGAMKAGLQVRQSEVHGMAQRGGAVQAHLRLADREIASDLIPQGGAQMILAMEPLESLRYLGYLGPDGVLISSADPLVNIPDYPELEGLLAAIRRLPRHLLVEATALAGGSTRAANMVLVGAAAPYLPVSREVLENSIRELFAGKGEGVVAANLKAFAAGLQAGGAEARAG
jgi:indolepyruvate ferredoxin oxidoreductase beta subunit